MIWSAIRRLASPGFRRKTLLLVSTFTALITIAYIGIFSYHIYSQKQVTDRQRLKAAAQLLSQVMRSDLYVGNIQSLMETAQSALNTFDLSKIRVTLPDGGLVMQTSDMPETGMAAETVDITIDQTLSPAEAIAQADLPRQTIGTVSVFSNGSELRRDARKTLAALLMTGCLLWVAVSYIGYLLMRRLTSSFDRLVEGIAAIEAGRIEQISIDSHDEAATIGKAINRMSSAIFSREQAKLIQANKMASLGLLVSCVGHEINNPNSIIRMQNELISHVVNDAEPLLKKLAETHDDHSGGMKFSEGMQLLKEALTSIHEQTERIDNVIGDLREYAAGTGSDREIVALPHAVESIMRLLRPQTRTYPGALEVIQEEPLPIIATNKNGLQQVVINLMQNALRATATKGSQGQVTIRSWGEGEWAWLSVSDNGCGIHPDDISRLCDPFFSRHLDSGGTGLGLFIARQIVEEHDGTIEFQSELGKGTTVTIRFHAINGDRQNFSAEPCRINRLEYTPQ